MVKVCHILPSVYRAKWRLWSLEKLLVATLAPFGHLYLSVTSTLPPAEGQSVTWRCCRMDSPKQKAGVCPFVSQWLSPPTAPPIQSEWLAMQGQWEQSPHCSAGAVQCQGLGCLRHWWAAAWHHGLSPVSFCRPLPLAESSALHLVGLQCILVELKWVLHPWSSSPAPGGGPTTKGFPLSLDGSESVLSTSSDISSIDAAARSTPC